MLRCGSWVANDRASAFLEAIISQFKQSAQAGKALFAIGSLVDGRQCCLDHGFATSLLLLSLGPEGTHKADNVCWSRRSVMSTRTFCRAFRA